MSAVDATTVTPPANVPYSAKEQAAEWFALLRSGEVTSAERVRWEAWLAASEDHRAAWSYVERIGQRFAPIHTSVDPRSTVRVLQTVQGRPVRRRQIVWGMATFGISGLLSWGAWRHTSLPVMVRASMADYLTAVGEIREIILADGSKVWLGSDSAFNVHFSANLRSLHLVAGDIFIETAADASRPFVVYTQHCRLRALGTRFNVRLEDEHTVLSVYEGAVEVHTTNSHETAIVHASQQTRLDEHAIEALVKADPVRESWIRHILIVQDMPLSQVVAELARYRHGHLGVAPEVASLGVYGSFPLNDTDQALDMLATILPIRVRQVLPWWSTVEAHRNTEDKKSTF